MKNRGAIFLITAAGLLIAIGGVYRRATNTAAPTVRYEEVADWPALPVGVQMGEAAGVAVDKSGHVFVFHRPGRGFDTTAAETLKDAPVLELDGDSGKLIRAWGEGTFLVPHGITIDGDDNVFLTDVGLHQVFKYSHDGRQLMALGEPRVGRWDATHFNQPTDVAVGPDGSFYVSDGYVNSRVALFDKSGRWVREWGKEGTGEGEFSNPHGLSFVPGSSDVIVADRQTHACSSSTAQARSGGSGGATRAPRPPAASSAWLRTRMVRCTWAFVGRTTTPSTPAWSSSTATGGSSRPSVSAAPAIRRSTPCTTSR